MGTVIGQGLGRTTSTTTTTRRMGLSAIDTAIGTMAICATLKSPTPSLDTISNSRTASLGQLRAVCMDFVAEAAFEIEDGLITVTYLQIDMTNKN